VCFSIFSELLDGPSEEPVKENESKASPVSDQPPTIERDTELEELKAENRRLREQMTSIQQKQETTSLEVIIICQLV